MLPLTKETIPLTCVPFVMSQLADFQELPNLYDEI